MHAGSLDGGFSCYFTQAGTMWFHIATEPCLRVHMATPTHMELRCALAVCNRQRLSGQAGHACAELVSTDPVALQGALGPRHAVAFIRDMMDPVARQLLSRFHTADVTAARARALQELNNGGKQTHWMWFVFPQLRREGVSPTSAKFALAGLEEARLFLMDQELAHDYGEAVRAVVRALDDGMHPLVLLGGSELDVMKLVSSLTLFEAVADGALAADITRALNNLESPVLGEWSYPRDASVYALLPDGGGRRRVRARLLRFV